MDDGKDLHVVKGCVGRLRDFKKTKSFGYAMKDSKTGCSNASMTSVRSSLIHDVKSSGFIHSSQLFWLTTTKYRIWDGVNAAPICSLLC